MNLGAFELSIILVIIVIFFGAKKIPELIKGVGLGIKDFQKAKKDINED
jgi:sec-independent protein translocase protein TatA